MIRCHTLHVIRWHISCSAIPPPPPPPAAAAAPWRCGVSFSQGANLSVSFPFVSYSASTLVYVEKEFEHPVNIEEHKVPHSGACSYGQHGYARCAPTLSLACSLVGPMPHALLCRRSSSTCGPSNNSTMGPTGWGDSREPSITQKPQNSGKVPHVEIHRGKSVEQPTTATTKKKSKEQLKALVWFW